MCVIPLRCVPLGMYLFIGVFRDVVISWFLYVMLSLFIPFVLEVFLYLVR